MRIVIKPNADGDIWLAHIYWLGLDLPTIDAKEHLNETCVHVNCCRERREFATCLIILYLWLLGYVNLLPRSRP
jgi:hypothetical protein